MDAIRNFFANFKKHGTISRTFCNRTRSLTNKASVLANDAKGTKGTDKQTDMDLKTNNKNFDVLEQQIEGISESLSLDSSIEIHQLDSQELIRNIAAYKHIEKGKDDTKACLKEFDEILEEINRDITEEYVSLDEIDDVLYNMAKEDNITEPLKLEIPRFDLQDLLPFDLATENNNEVFEPIYFDTMYDLNESYTKYPLEFDEIDKLNKITNEANLDSNNETSVYYNEINRNVQNADVMYISSEESQAHETDKRTHEPKDENKEYINVNDEPKNENDKYKAIVNEPKNVSYIEGSNVKNLVFKHNLNNCEEIIVKVPKNVIVENMMINDEPKKVNNESEETIKSIDVVFIDDSNDKELNKEKDESENVNDESNVKNRDIVSIDDSDDDCGYRTSDFEFITEEEAKMDGLIVNFDINSLERKVSKPKRVKTIEIAIDQFAYSPMRIDSEQLQGLLNNCPGSEAMKLDNVGPSLNNISNPGNNTTRQTANGLQINCSRNIGSSLRNVRKHWPRIINRSHNFNKNTETTNDGKNNGFGLNTFQRDDSVENLIYPNVSIDNKNGQGCTIQLNCTEASRPNCLGQGIIKREIRTNTLQRANPGINNVGPWSNLSKDSPGFNNFGPRSNNLQGNNPGFNNIGSGPNNSQESSLGFNNIGHKSRLMLDSNRPSLMQRNRPGPINSRNCPETYDPRIETLHRNQNQLVLDHSYREHHRVLIGEEYYRLFDSNFEPLPDQRLMENKSIMPTSTMFVEFDGVGFDMQMMRERNESEEDEEDDNVKDEADESSRKILEMYPVENRKRRKF